MEKYFTIRNGRANLASTKNFSTLHIGCITPYLGTKDNVPRGYLLADGASYKTTDYPELFDIIGYTYGGSDGTFNVPNLCDGRFLEGSDTSGEYVEAGLPNIEGKWVADSVYTPYFEGTLTGAFSAEDNGQGVRRWGSNEGNGQNTFLFDASLSNAIYGNSDTVQPKSLRVLYIIKAFYTNEGTDSKNEVSDPIIDYVEGEIAEVETALPNIKKFASPSETARYITISGTTLGDIEVHSAYAGKYMFTSTGAKPIFFGTSTYLGYTLTGWAWSSDKTKLYLRVNGQRDFVISAFGSDGVEISDMTTTAPTDVTFNTTFNYNAYIDNSTSENTSTYSSAKIDTELNKKLHTYSYQWYGSHNRYVKLGSVPISTGSVSVGSLLVTLFASTTKIEEYPIGTINLNISSGASANAFNINGFSTIALNIPRTNNYYTPRIVVDKTSTHYVLYIDCSYNYLKVNCSILNSTNFTFGDFETASVLEGTEVWSSVTSDDIKYVGDLAKLDDSSNSTTSTWSSSKIASEINPAIDISKVFSDGMLNIATLCSTYGNGRYVIVGQGTAGNGSATIDIWTLVGNAISYIVNVTYSNRTSNIFVGYTYDNPTINFETGYINSCNHIAKVCTLA